MTAPCLYQAEAMTMTHLDRHPAIVTYPCGCHTASHDSYDHPVLCRCPRHRGE